MMMMTISATRLVKSELAVEMRVVVQGVGVELVGGGYTVGIVVRDLRWWNGVRGYG
jgi:hypothetical protein